LIGNGRKYVIAVVVPDFDRLNSWAQQKGLETERREELARQPEVHALLCREVKRMTRHFASYEQPKKVLVVDREWTVEGGELTPTLKVRVKEIEKRYRKSIEWAYGEEQTTEMEVAAVIVQN
jgi:long-chain acyl-CoA synthetase